MKHKIKTYIKNKSKNISTLLWIYNHILGSNKIKVPSNNTFIIGTAVMKKTKITVNGINNTIIIKDLSRLINCNIYIQGSNNHIVINKKVYLNYTELYIEDDNNEICVGENTSVHGVTHLAAIEGTIINIGSDCMFSSDIHFRTGDSHSIIDLSGKRLNTSENIFIGNHVWIGTKVICLKGVHIANNCIVGAGSLITKKFSEENVILAGNPAIIVKHKIDWLSERIGRL
ncbi:acyltransferase [Clostridium sp.]|uniref:acyltransferase n=1 Tax=Clostridium sp. TaxID=1506 RepID=UPI003D6D491B